MTSSSSGGSIFCWDNLSNGQVTWILRHQIKCGEANTAPASRAHCRA